MSASMKSASRLLVFATLWMSVNVFAATFSVTTLFDGTDSAPGDGLCSSVIGGQCSLRAAIQEANALSSDDTILLSSATYILTEAGIDEDISITGDLDIFGSGELLIRGISAADTIIDGNSLDRVIHILDTAGKVTIEQLTIRGGSLIGNGGGILNVGPDTLIRSVEISQNIARTAFDAGKRSFGMGGGIYNDTAGGLILDQSYIAFNNASNFDFFDNTTKLVAGGGGIYNAGTLDVRNNSRVEDNLAQQGGGILNIGVANINDSIVAFNNSRVAGGGIFNWGGILTVRRSIISDNNCGLSCEGGGISNQPGAASEFNGAAVIGSGGNQFNGATGVAMIIESQVDNNSGSLSIGSGISNNSQMYIAYSSISWNRGDGIGAGISNLGVGDLTIENSSIVGNFSPSLGSYGVGIHTASKLRLDHVTMTGNFSASASFAQELYINTNDFDETDPTSWVTIKNSIIGDDAYRRKLEQRTRLHAVGAASDNYCGGGYSDEPDGTPLGSLIGNVVPTNDYLNLIRSEGYNLSNGYTCGLAGAGDLSNVAPELLDAGDYGGVRLPIGPFLPGVLSRPPAINSAVIDAVPASQCSIRFDQRLFGRPVVESCDIGSVEASATEVPYADIQLTATADKWQVNFGDDITYTIVVKNWGKDSANNLGGSAQPTNGVGQPAKPVVMSTFKFLNLRVTGASFSAPDPTGTVLCNITTTAENEEQAQCTYDRPLLPDTELLIYLRVTPQNYGWSLNNTAEVVVTNPPDPVSYNNRITLRRVTGIGPDTGVWWTPVDNKPVESSTGALSFSKLEISLFGVLLLLALIKRLLVMKTIRRSGVFTMIGGIVVGGAMVSFSLGISAAVPMITGITPAVGSGSTDTVITIQGDGFDVNARVALLNDSAISAISARVGSPPRPANMNVVKQNQYLYLHASRLRVYDVSDPFSPVLQSSNRPPIMRKPPPSLQEIGVFGSILVTPDNRLYATYSNRLGIFDYSDPVSPIREREFRVFTRSDGLHVAAMSAAAVDGNLLYTFRAIGSGNGFGRQLGLLVVDISKTTGVNIVQFTQWLETDRPRYMELFSVPTTEGLRKYVAFVGRYSSLEINGISQNGSLFIYDVTDLTKPAIAVGAYQGPNGSLIEDVAIKLVTTETGTRAYAIAATFANTVWGGGLVVYDITPDTGFSETSPVAFYGQVSNGLGVKLDGDIAIFHGRGDTTKTPWIVPAFWEFDVSDPTVPKLVGGPYSAQGEPFGTAPWPQNREMWDVDDGFIYSSGGVIYKTNPPLTNITITPTTITATVPAGYPPQVYDIIVTNSLGEEEEVRLVDGFTIQ